MERIDVTRGAQRAGETAGQSLVANVVRRPQAVAGTWSAALERNAEGLVYPRGELSIAAPLGAWRTTTKINAFWEQFPWVRFTRARFDAASAIELFEIEEAPSSHGEAYIASEAERAFRGGTLTINGRFGYSRFDRDTERFGFVGRFPAASEGTLAGADRRTSITFDSAYWDGELSADWTGAVRERWALKLLALGSFRDSAQSSADLLEQPVGETASIARFRTESLPIEVLSRATIGRTSGSFRPEFGLELAYNRLNSFIALEVEDASGIRPIDLPASDVTVAELRGDAFANLTWQPAQRWTIEAGLAAELSRITVAGDADNENSFTFLKPTFALTFQPSAALQLRAALRRTVGQLNFDDFAASANAEDDRVLAGNPDLGPDQTWRASFATDFRTRSGLAVNVEAFHEWREDVLEQVILPSGVAGLANAGSARVWGVEVDGALPLAAVLPGGLLEVTAAFRDARFRDPITGETRKITGLTNPEVALDFRQDLTALRFAWGVRYEPPTRIVQFFANESIVENQADVWTVFVETTRFLNVKMRLEVRNFGGHVLPRDRLLFAPDRGGAFVGSEILDRKRGEFARLTVSSQF